MLFCLSCGLGTYEFYVITAIPILKSPTLYPTQRRVLCALRSSIRSPLELGEEEMPGRSTQSYLHGLRLLIPLGTAQLGRGTFTTS